MPWESEKAELPTLLLAEVGSPVIALLAQPHRLEMRVVGLRKPLVYYPDVLLTVEESFLRLLFEQVPFGRAILEWRPDPNRRPSPRTLVVEVKDDNDRRRNKPAYMEKLRLAREVYCMEGMSFIEIVRSTDIDCANIRTVKDILLDKSTIITPVAVGRVTRYLRAIGGRGTLGGVEDALGGGAWAKAAVRALHVRRFISIDLLEPLSPESSVWLVRPYEREETHAD
jgi:hypothetical protein